MKLGRFGQPLAAGRQLSARSVRQRGGALTAYKPTARRFTIAFSALVGGLAAGALALYATIAWMTGSFEAALQFTALAVGFFLPLGVVFILAGLRTLRGPSYEPSEPSSRTKLAAAAYALCSVPFWFALVGAIQGRVALAVVLLVIYALCAYLPLRAAYRVRLWANMQASGI